MMATTGKRPSVATLEIAIKMIEEVIKKEFHYGEKK